MTRKQVATWLGSAPGMSEKGAEQHCRKQSLGPKETAEFMKAFMAARRKWAQ